MSTEELNTNCYDTLSEYILIDEEFDYYKLQDITRNQTIQFEEYMQKNMDPKLDYYIGQENLYYIVTEQDNNDCGEMCRFRIPTRNEDFNKPLYINSGLKEI